MFVENNKKNIISIKKVAHINFLILFLSNHEKEKEWSISLSF